MTSLEVNEILIISPYFSAAGSEVSPVVDNHESAA